MQIVFRLLSSRGKNKPFFPVLTFLRSAIRMEGGGEEKDRAAWLAGLFFWEQWLLMGHVTCLLITAGAVCGKSGCQFFSHCHWTLIILVSIVAQSLLSLQACACFREKETYDFFYNHFVTAACKLLVSAPAPIHHVFHGCTALKTRVAPAARFSASPRLRWLLVTVI